MTRYPRYPRCPRCRTAPALPACLPALALAGLLALAAPPAAAQVQPPAAPAQPPAGAAATAGTPTRVEVSQVAASGREVTLYVSVRDAAGAFLPGLTAAQFAVTIGRHPSPVTDAQVFSATGEGVGYLFLVDTSASLSAAQFSQIRAALTEWLGQLGPADRAGLIRFGERVTVLVEPTAGLSVNQAALTAALAPLGATDQRTALHGALLEGLTLARRRGPGLPQRRVLVTLTDGLNDQGGLGEARDVEASLAADPVPLYAVGFAGARVAAAERRRGLDALGAFARRSGGMLLDATAGGDPGVGLAALRTHIGEVYRVRVNCADCDLDGARHPVYLMVSAGAVQVPAESSVLLVPTPAAAPPAGPEPNQQAQDPNQGQPPDQQQGQPPTAETATVPPADDDAAAAGDVPPVTGPVAGANDDADATTDPSSPPPDDRPAWVWWAGGAVVLLGLLTALAAWRRRRPPPDTGSDARSDALTADPAADAPWSPTPIDPGAPSPGRSDPLAGVPLPGLGPFASDDRGDDRGSGGPRALPPTRDFDPAAPQPPAAAPPRVTLVIVGGARQGERVTLTLAPRALIGRAPSCDLVLADDERVSAHHAELLLSAQGRVVLRDLGSTNGTRLNGVPLTGVHPLADGDLIAVGDTTCRVLQ